MSDFLSELWNSSAGLSSLFNVIIVIGAFTGIIRGISYFVLSDRTISDFFKGIGIIIGILIIALIIIFIIRIIIGFVLGSEFVLILIIGIILAIL